MKNTVCSIGLAALISTAAIGLACAGDTSEESGAQSIGGAPPQGEGASAIPQEHSEASPKADKQSSKSAGDGGEDVSVDRDPAPRVPKVDKP